MKDFIDIFKIEVNNKRDLLEIEKSLFKRKIYWTGKAIRRNRVLFSENGNRIRFLYIIYLPKSNDSQHQGLSISYSFNDSKGKEDFSEVCKGDEVTKDFILSSEFDKVLAMKLLKLNA